MKKLIAMLLCLTLILSFAACAAKEEEQPTVEEETTVTEEETKEEETKEEETTEEETTEEETEEDNQPATMPEEGEEGGEMPEVGVDAATGDSAAALEILETIWADYADDEKFPVIGGNIENAVDGAPGAYDMAYAENMSFNLLIPAEQIANVTGVASMIHMMNANTFTCGVFTLAEGVSAEDFGAAMQAAVQGNMWMCGFPETLVIASFDGAHVLVAFGVNDAMNPFQTHLASAYPEAVTLVNEPIA